jgi:hypothetical protein
VCGNHRVLVVAFFDLQAEIDFVSRRVGQLHRRETASQRANRGEARLDRRRRRRIVAAVEHLLRAFGLRHDRSQPGLQRLGRIRARKLRDAGERDVDVVEEAGLVFVLLTGDRRVHQLVRAAAGTAAAAAEPGQGRYAAARALTLVIAARVVADLLIRASQELVVHGRVDSGDADARRRSRRRRRCVTATSSATSATASAARTAESRSEVQLSRLPRAQTFLQLLGEHRRIARRQIRLAREHRRRFVRAIAAAALDVHRQQHVRAQRPDQPHVVADDVLAAPFLDHFLGIERVAVIDRAREVLLGAVDAVGREQFRRPQYADIAKQLGTDLVLPAFTAVVLHVDRSQAHAVREHREERVGLVVWMRGRLHEGAGHVQLPDREPERNVAAVGRHDRVRHAVLRERRLGESEPRDEWTDDDNQRHDTLHSGHSNKFHHATVDRE